MRFRSFAFLASAAAAIFLAAALVSAQAPAPAARGRGAAPQAPVAVPAARGATQQTARVQGTLIQVMRGILFPASNVVFAAQSMDPAKVKQEDDPSTALNPLASSYGGWTAVENAGIALSEAANLLIIPGRKCSNGKPVPMQNADWQKWVQGLRDAGMATYKAAQTKSMDAMLDAADVMSTACSNCHDKYREVPSRC